VNLTIIRVCCECYSIEFFITVFSFSASNQNGGQKNTDGIEQIESLHQKFENNEFQERRTPSSSDFFQNMQVSEVVVETGKWKFKFNCVHF